jgi:hypothetical protein
MPWISTLQERGTSKPRAVKTLGSTINSLFQKSLSEQEISAIIKELEMQGAITITENKVVYAA